MRHALVISLGALVAGVAVSVAPAAGIGPAWTVPKAERILVRDATVQMPSTEKATLESELRRTVMLFRGLELGALELRDDNAFWTYHNWANRYQNALESVQHGLRVSDASCAGAGRAIGPGKFQRFDCLVSSAILSIPSTELDGSSNEAMPAIVEGEARDVGPYFTQLRVRITGKSTLAYR